MPLGRRVSLHGTAAPQEMSLEEALQKMGLPASARTQRHFPEDLLHEVCALFQLEL